MFSTATGFTYAGQKSETYNIILARASSLPSYQVGLSYNPLYDKIKYVDRLFSYGNDKNPLEFELEMYKETFWTVKDRKNICSWLFKNNFEDLIFANDVGETDPNNQHTDVVYNCQPTGRPESCDYGNLYGIKIKFLSSLPYATTQLSTQYHDLSTIGSTPTIIEFVNRGNLNEYFYDTTLEIQLTGSNTSVQLKNVTDGGRIVSFTTLSTNELITMVNQLGILTSSTGLDRYSKWNKNWFRLTTGTNYIEVTGACELTLQAKYPLIL